MSPGLNRVKSEDLWVFGYGSLMWRPGFVHEEVRPALLRGYHRSFCIYSHHYRGTKERPGLVLGLSHGGACRGLAFRIAEAEADTAIAYLNDRELVTYAYLPKTLPVDIGEQRVMAYTFVADPCHGQYAGNLGLARSAELIMNAEGIAGLNRDYLINTIRQLEAHGFSDDRLHALRIEVERLTGIIQQGEGI